jgi:hypothetical protein
MNVSPMILQQIRLLSDEPLYQQAITLAQQHPKVSDAQLNGLLQYARVWSDLERFVARQRQRNWAQSKSTEHYKAYYDELHEVLRQFRRDAAQFVPSGLTKRDREDQTTFFAGLLAWEFVQHLVAEAKYRRVVPIGRPEGATPTGSAEE